MSTLTKEQIDALPEMVADAMAGPWFRNEENDVCIQIDGQHHAVCTDQFCYGSPEEKDANARLIALAPSLASTVIEQRAEIERLRGIVRELIEMLDYDRTSGRYRVAVDAAYSEIDQ